MVIKNQGCTRWVLLVLCTLTLAGCAEDQFDLAAQGSKDILTVIKTVEEAGYSGVTSYSSKGIKLISALTGSVSCETACPISTDKFGNVKAVLAKYGITQLVREGNGGVYMTLQPAGLSRGAMLWEERLPEDAKKIGEYSIVRRLVNGWSFVTASE